MMKLALPRLPRRQYISIFKGVLAYTLAFVLFFIRKFNKTNDYPVTFTGMILVVIASKPGSSIGAFIDTSFLGLLGVGFGGACFVALAQLGSTQVAQGFVFLAMVYVLALIKGSAMRYFAFALLAILLAFAGKSPTLSGAELALNVMNSQTYLMDITPEEKAVREELHQSCRSDMALLAMKLREVKFEVNWTRWEVKDYASAIKSVGMMQQGLLTSYSSLVLMETQDLGALKLIQEELHRTGAKTVFFKLLRHIVNEFAVGDATYHSPAPGERTWDDFKELELDPDPEEWTRFQLEQNTAVVNLLKKGVDGDDSLFMHASGPSLHERFLGLGKDLFREHTDRFHRKAAPSEDSDTAVPLTQEVGEATAIMRVFSFIHVEGLLRGDLSIYALKTAVATTTYAVFILAPSLRAWFVDYGLTTGVLTIVVALAPTLGQTLFTFVLQILGTGIGTLYGMIVLYIFRGAGSFMYNPYGLACFLALFPGQIRPGFDNPGYRAEYNNLFIVYVEALAPLVPDTSPGFNEEAIVAVRDELLAMENRIQMDILGMMPLLKFSAAEPAFGRPFRAALIAKLIRQLQIILDRYREARTALGTTGFSKEIRENYVQRFAPYRHQAKIILRTLFYLAATSLATKKRLPHELPAMSEVARMVRHDAMVLSRRLAQTEEGTKTLESAEFVKYWYYLVSYSSLGHHLETLMSDLNILFDGN
ncbi:hypothetical protein MNV49_005687 [Pseudohyphozyma bogoriensis]|nr:hypothetical protein MNV49_005687 [Pseudohyphozyma bogoriensis]